MLGHYSTSLGREELRNTFLAGGKKRECFAVGVEWEKIGIYRNNGEAVRYSGKRSVNAIFDTLVRERGWEAIQASNGLPIALKKGKLSVTLEPGGQIELSGQKAWRLSDNAEELFSHLKEIKDVSDPLGMVWLGLGAQPFDTAEDIEWVPKDRYAVMREKLAQRGSDPPHDERDRIRTDLGRLSRRKRCHRQIAPGHGVVAGLHRAFRQLPT